MNLITEAMPEALRWQAKSKIMDKNLNMEKELGFEELEDRLEMAQVASGDVARCGGSIEQAGRP